VGTLGAFFHRSEAAFAGHQGQEMLTKGRIRPASAAGASDVDDSTKKSMDNVKRKLSDLLKTIEDDMRAVDK
jgi:hypothetical protein